MIRPSARFLVRMPLPRLCGSVLLLMAFATTQALAQPANPSAPMEPAVDAPADTVAPPPAALLAAPLSTWLLEGELIDKEDVVRSFLRPMMQESQNWSTEEQRNVTNFLVQLGYHCDITNEALADGSLKATLKLAPITLVRHVEVDLDTSIMNRLRQPIFADEIGRRMTLRPGAPLAANKVEREEQLRSEAERLRLYLINDGFYDAEVEVSERSDGPFQSRVTVTVRPGLPYFIGVIEVDGNLALESDEIDRLFRHKRICLVWRICFGRTRFSRQALLKDVKRLVALYQKRGYPGVRIRHDYDPRHSFRRSDKKINLRIEVRERRLINVEFEGNRESVPRAELMKRLTLSEVASYDDVEVQASAEAIRAYYQDQGFFEAHISWKRELFPEVNFERILFLIDEGPRLRVRSVKLLGNTSITNEALRANLRTRIYKRIIVGDSGGFATTQQLEQDAGRILSSYRKAGFREAQVRLEVSRGGQTRHTVAGLAAAIAAGLPAKGLAVAFHITEGPRSLVKDVRLVFEGEQQLPDRVLRKRLKLRHGKHFSEDVAREDGDRLRHYYYAQGFPRATVKTSIETDGNSISILHSIKESSPARIGKIAIRGNFKTHDWVILDEMKLKEGQRLTLEAEANAQANLRQSGLFATAQVSYIGRDNPRREVVNVLVRVEERGDYGFHYSGAVGYASDSLFFAEAGSGIPNLFGIGARTNITAHIGQKLIQGELSFRLPHWAMNRYLGAELNFDARGSYKADETERFGELTTYGLSLALSKEARRGFFRGWLFSLRYDGRLRYNDVPLVRPSGNSDDIQETKVTTISSSIGPRLVIDKRRDRKGNRNPLTPAKGYRVELDALFAEDCAFGSARFLKLGFAGQAFFTLGEKLTLSTGLRYDHGVPLGGDSLLPQVERFFAGGDTTVRGYEEDHLAVEFIDNPLAPLGSVTQFRQFRVVPASGNIRLINNIDLQLEVWQDPWVEFPIATAIFLDSGMITNSLDGLDIDAPSFGVGLALLRWVSPVGSFSIEYAIPLNIKIGDNPRGRFHLNLGVLFN
ncbi:MAG: BamA/TamA family outer membrane protein [Myxococcales bacterium]|nr:BamA/TamA family outer membrane protein [Myxococcales bacterium]